MRRDDFTRDDLRQLPAYGIPEAAGYLRLPASTLRSWILGQRYYDAQRRAKLFRPVIEVADSKRRLLSFSNLVEASFSRASGGSMRFRCRRRARRSNT